MHNIEIALLISRNDLLPAVATSVHFLEFHILGSTAGCRLLHMSDDLFHVSGREDLIRSDGRRCDKQSC
jgi:hypothetical protein